MSPVNCSILSWKPSTNSQSGIAYEFVLITDGISGIVTWLMPSSMIANLVVTGWLDLQGRNWVLFPWNIKFCDTEATFF